MGMVDVTGVPIMGTGNWPPTEEETIAAETPDSRAASRVKASGVNPRLIMASGDKASRHLIKSKGGLTAEPRSPRTVEDPAPSDWLEAEVRDAGELPQARSH